MMTRWQKHNFFGIIFPFPTKVFELGPDGNESPNGNEGPLRNFS